VLRDGMRHALLHLPRHRKVEELRLAERRLERPHPVDAPPEVRRALAEKVLFLRRLLR